MKKVVLKYISALLAVWYCMSIIGFDIHSCTVTGNTFVNSILSGITCDDIHPEHDCCGHGGCCQPHKCCGCETPAADTSLDNEDCCTNDIEVLDSEVVASSDDDNTGKVCASSLFAFVENDYSTHLYAAVQQVPFLPDSWSWKKPDKQAVLNIWRI